jgi:hypothetical protein
MIVLNGNNTRIEPRFEIESPTTMTLCVNYESLFYFCSKLEDTLKLKLTDLIFYDVEIIVCIVLIMYVLNFHTITVIRITNLFVERNILI